MYRASDDEDYEKKTESRRQHCRDERETERDSLFLVAVSEQFKDTARTSSTRIKVVGTGSGAWRSVAQIYARAYSWSMSGSLRESLSLSLQIDPISRRSDRL